MLCACASNRSMIEIISMICINVSISSSAGRMTKW
uniref:Uncharacterized protein n=1 Tax=Arundo donax TaxID=35708 RepID=A0A0A9GP41_ARUDO